MFGSNRLEASIARHASASAEFMAKGIVDDVLRHAKDGQVDDDMTLVVVTGN
jgi:serine phosphatase RsbU (regulator of sigma subunit)